MKRKGVDEFLISELREGGLGSDLFNEAKEQRGQVSVKNFLTWLNVELHGQLIIQSLVESFNTVEMLEHYNDYFKMRVPR